MNKTFNKVGFILAVLMFLPAYAPTRAGQDLLGSSWVLVSLDGDTQVGEVIGGQAVTLSFEGSSQAGGSGGCNSFGAAYSANPATGSISFSEIVSTLMACTGEGIGEVEAIYFATLNGAESYEQAGNKLTISGGGHTLVFERTSKAT